MNYQDDVPEHIRWLSEGYPQRFKWTLFLLLRPWIERVYDRAWPVLSWDRAPANCHQFCSHEDGVDCWRRWSGRVDLKILYWNFMWQPYTLDGIGILSIDRSHQLRAAEGFYIL